MRVVRRNFRCRSGEIDLVMLDGDDLVFVEVRFRRSDRFGDAASSITQRKQHRIIRAAEYYLARHRKHQDRPCRFDVVAIDMNDGGLNFDWIKGAFSA
jgi:putative endonuclease